MLVSKREFNKLSKKDQNLLLQNNNKKRAGQQPAPNKPKKSKAGSKVGSRQASVAAAYATTNVGRAPVVKATRDTCNIKHRELLSGVTGSSDFTVQESFSMNPGLSSSFPWLSIMAQGWEEYRFKSLRYCYMTRTGSQTPGSIMMAPDYDAADAPPATEQIAASYSQVVEDAPWKDICCVIKQSNLQGTGKRHFVRTGPLAQNLDVKTYDVGTLHLCTVDGTAIPWGKLWVEYDIDFFIPALPPTGAGVTQGGTVFGGGVLSLVNPLGSSPIVDPQNSGFTIGSNSVFTLDSPGDYLMTFVSQGTGLSNVTVQSTPNLLDVTALSVVNVAGTQILSQFLVTCPANQQFYVSVSGTTVTSSTLRVAKTVEGSNI